MRSCVPRAGVFGWIALVGLLAVFAAAASAQDGPERREIVFSGEGGVPLAGTLMLPPRAGGERVPALLLIQGSGPTDRDGNQPPALISDLLRALAEAATAKGFATLRYDKRGTHANKASFPSAADKLAEFSRWENFIGDAGAAFRALAALPEVDPARVAILGHSEGGVIALVLGASPESRPAGLVLAAAPGRPLHVLVREQVRASMVRAGTAPILREGFLAAYDEVVEHIRKTGKVPPGLTPPMSHLFPAYLGLYFQGVFAADPSALAPKFPGPVLILQGERDLQVSAERDAAALEAALRRRAGGEQTLRVFAMLSHNFKPASGPADHAFAGPLPAEVSAALTEWLAGRFASRR